MKCLVIANNRPAISFDDKVRAQNLLARVGMDLDKKAYWENVLVIRVNNMIEKAFGVKNEGGKNE